MPSLTARDELFKHGTLEHRLVETAPGHASKTQTTKLIFGSDGRMVETILHPLYMPDSESIAYIKGEDYKYSVTVTGQETTVEFDKRPGFWSRRESSLQYIDERPSLPLGLGMANHEVSSTQPLKEGVRIICNKEPGVTSHIDFDKSGLPVEAYFDLGPGGTVSWAYEGAVRASDKLNIPARAHLAIKFGNGKVENYSYTIDKADFDHQPSNDELTYPWFKPGVFVMDRRVNPPVGWEYAKIVKANGGVTDITPDELLKLSQGMSKHFAVQLQSKDQLVKNREARIKAKGFELLGLFLALPAIVFGLIIWRRKKSATAHSVVKE